MPLLWSLIVFSSFRSTNSPLLTELTAGPPIVVGSTPKAMIKTANTQTKRTTVKRLPKRGNYDRETINAILDEGFICHVGFVLDGQPYVIPTGYARIGNDTLHSRIRGEPNVAQSFRGHQRLRNRDADRWTGIGSFGVSSFDELSFGRHSRYG